MPKSSSEQIRAWTGPAVFSFGFRPFFLFGALWVVIAMVIWLTTLATGAALPTHFDPVSWHAHEFLFGYLGAIVAGFLLTAVPNWTGRLPLVGWPLAGIFALWVLGRVAIAVSAWLPAGVAVSIDLAFPILLGAMILREIIAGKNWRNLVVFALLVIFTIANAIFHYEAQNGVYAAQGLGLRLGIATAIMMIAVIGGRIIPSFTRNWLVKQRDPARPAPPMQRFDKLTLLASMAILGFWVIKPVAFETGMALIVFAGLHLSRLARWQGHRTGSEPLVFVLHASYAFIPLGGFAIGIDLMGGGTGTAGTQHLWMAGAIGAMTLAVMTRASLGHTGQTLAADPATSVVYFCVFGAAATRALSPLWYSFTYLSGLLWIAGFAGFAIAYGPLLVRPKPERP